MFGDFKTGKANYPTQNDFVQNYVISIKNLQKQMKENRPRENSSNKIWKYTGDVSKWKWSTLQKKYLYLPNGPRDKQKVIQRDKWVPNDLMPKTRWCPSILKKT